MQLMLKSTEICKSYNVGNTKVEVLNGINLDVKEGEIIVILGRSGSGKTTFLNILGGILSPDKGRVTLKEKNIYSLNDRQLSEVRNKQIGFIFQDFQLINELNVLENIRLPFDISNRKYDKEYEKKIINMLGLEERLSFYPNLLSGGECQRVAVARALVKKPDIVLADEPTGNLDQGLSNELIEFVKESNEQLGQTYIIVTHDDEWCKIAHRTVYIQDGRICYEKKEYN